MPLWFAKAHRQLTAYLSFFLPAEQMDALFNQCFFHALKCKVKKSDLPLLTSTFLGSHMVSCWYVGRRWNWDLHAGIWSLKCGDLCGIFRKNEL